jgi:hypothetical protein
MRPRLADFCDDKCTLFANFKRHPKWPFLQTFLNTGGLTRKGRLHNLTLFLRLLALALLLGSKGGATVTCTFKREVLPVA